MVHITKHDLLFALRMKLSKMKIAEEQDLPIVFGATITEVQNEIDELVRDTRLPVCDEQPEIPNSKIMYELANTETSF